jgi:hypothetical protein
MIINIEIDTNNIESIHYLFGISLSLIRFYNPGLKVKYPKRKDEVKEVKKDIDKK